MLKCKCNFSQSELFKGLRYEAVYSSTYLGQFKQRLCTCGFRLPWTAWETCHLVQLWKNTSRHPQPGSFHSRTRAEAGNNSLLLCIFNNELYWPLCFYTLSVCHFTGIIKSPNQQCRRIYIKTWPPARKPERPFDKLS